MAKYKLSQKAVVDITHIWEYTASTWSVNQAQKYNHLLQNRMEEISDDPFIGSSYEHVRPGYFRLKVKSHIIFYRMVDNTVEIVRILHERMDLDSHL